MMVPLTAGAALLAVLVLIVATVSQTGEAPPEAEEASVAAVAAAEGAVAGRPQLAAGAQQEPEAQAAEVPQPQLVP